MAAWQAIYGSPLVLPQGKGFMRWTSPALGAVLLSDWHGLFTWTPLVAVAVAGLVPLFRLQRRVGVVVAVSLCCLVRQRRCGRLVGRRGVWLSAIPELLPVLRAGTVGRTGALRVASRRSGRHPAVSGHPQRAVAVSVSGVHERLARPRALSARLVRLVARTLRGAFARARPPVRGMTTVAPAPRMPRLGSRDARTRHGRRVGLLLVTWMALFYVFTAAAAHRAPTPWSPTSSRDRWSSTAPSPCQDTLWIRRASGHRRPLLLAIRHRAVGRQRPILPRGQERRAAWPTCGHRRFDYESGRRHGQHARNGGDDLAGLFVRRDAHRLSARGACHGLAGGRGNATVAVQQVWFQRAAVGAVPDSSSLLSLAIDTGSDRLAVWSGMWVGLALLTRHELILAVVPLMPFFLLSAQPGRRGSGRSEGSARGCSQRLSAAVEQHLAIWPSARRRL